MVCCIAPWVMVITVARGLLHVPWVLVITAARGLLHCTMGNGNNCCLWFVALHCMMSNVNNCCLWFVALHHGYWYVVVFSHSSMDVCMLLFHYATHVVSYVYYKRCVPGISLCCLVLVVHVHVK